MGYRLMIQTHSLIGRIFLCFDHLPFDLGQYSCAILSILMTSGVFWASAILLRENAADDNRYDMNLGLGLGCQMTRIENIQDVNRIEHESVKGELSIY
jgi:hypothetical protein